MVRYAQTNIQLYNQLQESRYTSSDMELIRRAYDLAVQAFTGRFEQSGKVFVAHGVGVASILVSLGADAEIVAAGLVHNIYRSGDFGFGADGVTKKKRARVAEQLGDRVEKMLYYFARWTRKFGHADDEASYLRSAEKEKQDVVLLAIADQLEKMLDGEILYFRDCEERLEQMGPKVPRLAAAACHLGYPQLAQEVERRFGSVREAQVDAVLRSDSSLRFSEVIKPASHSLKLRRRLGLLLQPTVGSVRRYIGSLRVALRLR